jgi:hypothetical protein
MYTDINENENENTNTNENLFVAQRGTIRDKTNMENIKKFVMKNYKNELKNEATFHEYIYNTPRKFQQMVYKVKHSHEILNKICYNENINENYNQNYKKNKCNIKFLDNIDELYISHYNIDNAGDQGLFDKHYDGVLKFIKDGTIIRALVYVNSEDNFVVHFIDSNKNINFKSNDFALLDFNREYHYVDESFSNTNSNTFNANTNSFNSNSNINNDRIILKLHYMICPNCTEAYANTVIFFNKLFSFDITRTAMNYSKNPKNIFQSIIGYFCNLFRKLNNISIYLVFLFVILLLILVYYLFILIFYFFKTTFYNKVIKKN